MENSPDDELLKKRGKLPRAIDDASECIDPIANPTGLPIKESEADKAPSRIAAAEPAGLRDLIKELDWTDASDDENANGPQE